MTPASSASAGKSLSVAGIIWTDALITQILPLVLRPDIGEEIHRERRQPVFTFVIAAENVFQSRVGLKFRRRFQNVSARVFRRQHRSRTLRGPRTREVQADEVNHTRLREIGRASCR